MKSLRLSDRLAAVAALCGSGECIADVGCDHAYLPIYLLREQRFRRAVAMDLRPGPLAAARQHILDEGLTEQIECRLSDGLMQLKEGEADTLVCAGMGGELIRSILVNGGDKKNHFNRIILQPQSELYELRMYLRDGGYRILAEDMVKDDGKYYPMLCVRYNGGRQEFSESELRYGGLCLRERRPLLKEYLEWSAAQLSDAITKAHEARSERGRARLAELECERNRLREVLGEYYSREGS